MSSFVSRFLEEDRSGALDALFGCSEWRTAKALTGQARIDFLVQLYEGQLKAIGSTAYVRSFEIADQNDRPLYHLVFATTSWRGLEVMKEAMFRLDRTGSYRFSDYLGLNQKTLLDYTGGESGHWGLEVARTMWKAFGGQELREEAAHRWTILSTRYIYRKKAILRPLEMCGAITGVDPRPRRFTYPSGCVIQFSPWPGDDAARRALETGSTPAP